MCVFRGVQGQKLCEHDFEITCDPKEPLRGPTFWLGFESLDPIKRRRGGHALFPVNKGPKNQNQKLSSITYAQLG